MRMPKTGSKRSLSPSATNSNRNKVPKTDRSACGIIKHISLTNFMCHSSFEWSPNRNVNFVTGANGSGKSSILQGLVLGLLADSKHTKRYTKLQDFIMKGERKAEIMITLKNEGEDAWKPEQYGDSIIFQRTFWESGQTSVVIKNANKEGVVKKNKEAREEGKRILQCFRINTDNPIAILQQEEAKELLKVESPEALYLFFQKSTLLKQCIEQYTAAKTELDKAKETIQDKKSGLTELKRKYDKEIQDYNQMIKVRQYGQDEARLSKEYVVSLGLDKLKEIEAVQEDINKKSEAQKKANDKLLSINEQNGKNVQKKVELESQLEEERQKYADKETELANIKLDIDRLKEEERSTLKEINGLGVMKQATVSELNILQEQHKSLNNAASVRQRKQREAERLKELQIVDQRMVEINEGIRTLGIQRDALDGNIDKNAKDIKQSEYEKKAQSSKLEKLNAELKDMKNQGNQQLALFDTMAPKVADRIRQAVSNNRFRTPPIGPVGSRIKLTTEAVSKDLSRLIETELGASVIRSYLCNDDNDRKVLWSIFDDVYGQRKKPNIFTSKFLNKKHNVSRVNNKKVVMDYLDIVGSQLEESVVFNFLVDQKSIESVVIAGSQEEAKQMCTFIQNVPKNLNYVLTPDFNKFFPPTKTSSYRSYYVDAVQSCVLGSNMSAMMEKKQQDIEKCNEAFQFTVNNLIKLGKVKASLNKEMEEIRSQIADHRQQLGKCNETKTQLRAEEDPAESSDSLQEKIERNKSELGNIENQQQIKVDEKKVILNTTKAKTSDYNKLLKHVSTLRSVTSPLESEISKVDGMISSKKKEIMNQTKVEKRYAQDVGVLKKKLSELQKEKNTIDKKIKKLNAEDVTPSGTSKQLESKILNVKKKLQEQTGIDQNVFKEKEASILKLRENYDQQKKKISNFEEHVKSLEKMNSERNTNYLFIRNTISNMVQRRFTYLSETFRNEFGSAIFIRLNHKKRELSFLFKNSEGEDLDTEINSLSGGEKSYAQMCLIAALWEHMNPPFRALDEWDVFLDAINRKKISNTLLTFGLTHLDNQFLFISPQGAGDIDYEPVDSAKISIREVIKA